MQFLGKPKPLLPFMNTKDCSLRLCSTFCPKWCDGIIAPFVPPPPFAFPEDKSQTSPTFSPLVIAIIGILASAFLLVSYYALISKYCGKNPNSSRENNHVTNNQENIEEDYYDGSNNNHQHEAWLISTPGLDEALIKSITLVKYIKGDGLITNSSDCSVCLGEFLEDDTLRLLPKCSHAFHVACIDTWLRSHSNCPLCRANIISPTPNTSTNPSLVVDNNVRDHINVQSSEDVININNSSEETSDEMGDVVEQTNGSLPKTNNSQFRALSDLSVRGHGVEGTMRRSVSMDHRYETRVSIPVVVRNNHGEEDCVVKISQFHDQASKRADGESSSKVGGCNNSSNPSVSMKRSFSSGRFLFSKHGKARNAVIIPL